MDNIELRNIERELDAARTEFRAIIFKNSHPKDLDGALRRFKDKWNLIGLLKVAVEVEEFRTTLLPQDLISALILGALFGETKPEVQEMAEEVKLPIVMENGSSIDMGNRVKSTTTISLRKEGSYQAFLDKIVTVYGLGFCKVIDEEHSIVTNHMGTEVGTIITLEKS